MKFINTAALISYVLFQFSNITFGFSESDLLGNTHFLVPIGFVHGRLQAAAGQPKPITVVSLPHANTC
jgi:hypothetical protein